LNVVNELLVCYKRYQLSLLKGSLLEYEYNQLFDECQLDDVELYVAGRNAVSSLYLDVADDMKAFGLETQIS